MRSARAKLEAGTSNASRTWHREQQILQIVRPSILDNHTVDPNRCDIDVAQCLEWWPICRQQEFITEELLEGLGGRVVWVILEVDVSMLYANQYLSCRGIMPTRSVDAGIQDTIPSFPTLFFRSTWNQRSNCGPILASVRFYRILQLLVFVF
jgi:hypothetical protein